MVENLMIENLMKLHKCSNCSIRCRAMAKPDSVFALIHRWHMTWWPGWKIYQRELRARAASQASPLTVAAKAAH